VVSINPSFLMKPADPSPEQAAASLVGCPHAIGFLELRRLLLEGATLAFPETSPDVLPAIFRQFVVIQATDSPAFIRELLPGKDELLVCLSQGWKPATELAERLSFLGYQHVYTLCSHDQEFHLIGVSDYHSQL